MRYLILLILPLFLISPSLAVTPDERLSDPVLEERARDISRGLRCVVCQNQSIDDSDAGLARDLRLLVRERLQAGDSDAEVTDFIVARYGEFVLMRPRMGLHTLALWIAPFLVFLVGGFIAFSMLRSRRKMASEPALSLEEEARINALLDKDKRDERSS